MFQNELKSLEALNNPDPTRLLVKELSPSAVIADTIEDHYRRIENISLLQSVPEEVSIQFNIARNLLLYSWYVFRFVPVAELYAYASLEHALRIKTDRASGANQRRFSGLKSLLKHAISEKWIHVEQLPHYQRLEEIQTHQWERAKNLFGDPDVWVTRLDPIKYADQLLGGLPALRNELAHGTHRLSLSGYLTLEICRDIIQQLFSNED